MNKYMNRSASVWCGVASGQRLQLLTPQCPPWWLALNIEPESQTTPCQELQPHQLALGSQDADGPGDYVWTRGQQASVHANDK